MNERPHRFAETLLAWLKTMWRGRPTPAGEPRGPEDSVAMSRDGGLRDAGRVGEQRRLHRIAEWTRLRGRGL